MNEISKFSSRLYELMNKQEINNYTLSKNIGCQDQTIANWLQGMYMPRNDMLLKLADYFNCSIDYLLGLTENLNYIRNDQYVTFVERFIFFLNRNNVTSYKVAKECQISKPATTKWIKHKAMPDTVSLMRLAKYFDCSIDFLLGRAAI